MSEKDDLIESIAAVISTYREGELHAPDPLHVERWANQFTPENQIAFLREFDHVIKQTYITEDVVSDFLKGLINNKKITGEDPAAYWTSANFLSIQGKGQSQKAMLKLFGELLLEQLGIDIKQCGSVDGEYIYLDDILFSGGRISTDLKEWIKNSGPTTGKVNVILIALHSGGHHYISNNLNRLAKEVDKKINITFWRLCELENRNYYRNDSDILWPAVCPDDLSVKAYIEGEEKYPLQYRTPMFKKNGIFSSEEQRQLLESEFLIAGLKIISKINTPGAHIRPLGFGRFGVGFGSLLVTYRNCPNNCPLALWWGESDSTNVALQWHPLFPRKTYASPENIFNGIVDI